MKAHARSSTSREAHLGVAQRRQLIHSPHLQQGQGQASLGQIGSSLDAHPQPEPQLQLCQDEEGLTGQLDQGRATCTIAQVSAQSVADWGRLWPHDGVRGQRAING